MNIKKIFLLGRLKIVLWKEERRKGSLQCCLLHNSNLPTLHVVLPPETAWDCSPTNSLCSFSQSGYFGVVVRRAILGITTPDGTRAATRAMPWSLSCLARCGALERGGVRGEHRSSARLAACNHSSICKHCRDLSVQPPWLSASAAVCHRLLDFVFLVSLVIRTSLI